MSSGVYGLRLLAKPSVRRVVLGFVVGLVLLVRVGQFLIWLQQPVWSYDFGAYWAAAQHLLSGQTPYTPEQLSGTFFLGPANLYQYPPTLAALLVPFAYGFAFVLGPGNANWLWAIAGALVLTWSTLALVRTERLAERFPLLEGRGRWWAVAAVFAFPPVIDELVVGNVNAFFAGLLTAAWLGYRRRDQRGDLIVGIAIGAATAVKLFPAVLILWLLLVGRRRAAVWSIVAAAVLGLATLPITGIQPWLDYLTVIRNLSINLAQPDALAPTFWLTPVLGFAIARVVVTVAGLAILFWTARAPDERLGFSIAILVAILVTPTLYGSYLTVLIVPMLLGLAACAPLGWTAIAYILMWGGQQSALGDWEWVVTRGLPTAGVILLLALLVRTSRRPALGAASYAPA